MLTTKRKSIKKLTASGLKKCTQFYSDGVHVCCTPSEYFALVAYFDAKPHDAEYTFAKIAKGDCSLGNHYIHVKKWNDVFPKNKYACLDTRMCMPY